MDGELDGCHLCSTLHTQNFKLERAFGWLSGA